MPQTLLTIAILSHNHEKFIEKTIKSVLSQNCTYPVEILIFDDASSDNTSLIIKKMGEEYPSIKLFLFPESAGPVIRARQIYENANGKYITWLDGDDYWTYNSKLQIQLDFLEKNPEYTGCFHDAFIRSEIETSDESAQENKQSLQGYRYYSQFNHYESDFYPYHLLQRNIIPTASLVFRKSDFSIFFDTFHLPHFSFSWAFQLQVIGNSKFKYFNRCWSVYRDHKNGISKAIPAEKFLINNINILQFFKTRLPYCHYKNHIYRAIAGEYELLIVNNITGKMRLKYALLCHWYYLKTALIGAWYYKLLFIKNILRRE